MSYTTVLKKQRYIGPFLLLQDKMYIKLLAIQVQIAKQIKKIAFLHEINFPITRKRNASNRALSASTVSSVFILFLFFKNYFHMIRKTISIVCKDNSNLFSISVLIFSKILYKPYHKHNLRGDYLFCAALALHMMCDKLVDIWLVKTALCICLVKNLWK